MDTYYEILGLKPGASQQEIKKAYFRQIRKHSPESDPKGFQEIRRAYDELKKALDTPAGPAFAPFEEPAARQLAQQMLTSLRKGDQEGGLTLCEQARNRFPNERYFLYHLAALQRSCGKTGSSVKNAELLVRLEPDNQWFLRELALSYFARGYHRKAFTACGQAYGAGCRDVDFLLIYAEECNSNQSYDLGIRLLLDLVRSKERWNKENISGFAEAYIHLMGMEPHAQQEYSAEILEQLCSDLKKYGIYLYGYMKQLITILLHMCLCRRSVIKNYQPFIAACNAIEALCHEEEEEEFLEAARTEIEYAFLSNDARLNQIFLYTYESYFYSGEEDEEVQMFSRIDVQLCMLKEREEIIGQIPIIRLDYPHFYQTAQDFLERLEARKHLTYLKNSLLKTYCQLEQYISGGLYFERYPEERAYAKKIGGQI